MHDNQVLLREWKWQAQKKDELNTHALNYVLVSSDDSARIGMKNMSGIEEKHGGMFFLPTFTSFFFLHLYGYLFIHLWRTHNELHLFISIIFSAVVYDENIKIFLIMEKIIIPLDLRADSLCHAT